MRVGTPEYTAWCHMKARCLNSKHPNYHHYGGRGITVCERWLQFEHFLADMGPRPSSKYSLDRIDNDGNYEPGNVRWATRAEQMRNRRNNRSITYNGETKCLQDWATEIGVKHQIIQSRLNDGWAIDEALGFKEHTRGPRKDSKFFTLDGETLSIRQWAERVGITIQSLKKRLAKGWDLRDALTKGRSDE